MAEVHFGRRSFVLEDVLITDRQSGECETAEASQELELKWSDCSTMENKHANSYTAFAWQPFLTAPSLPQDGFQVDLLS